LLICNFSRVAQATPVCKQSADHTCVALLQLRENSNPNSELQAHALWKAPLFVGNSRYWRAMTPRSVRPFTKYCIAKATSSRPITRTRTRMPVSPITFRTLPAPASTQ